MDSVNFGIRPNPKIGDSVVRESTGMLNLLNKNLSFIRRKYLQCYMRRLLHILICHVGKCMKDLRPPSEWPLHNTAVAFGSRTMVLQDGDE